MGRMSSGLRFSGSRALGSSCCLMSGGLEC